MNTRTNIRIAGVGLVLAWAAAAGSVQAASFFDGVFNNSDWSLTVLTNATGTGSTAQGFQVLTGGNPNEYRRVRHQLVVTGQPFNGAVHSLHLNNNAFYTPSTQGAISYIDYKEDSINFVPATVVPGNGQGSGLLILQNGKYYRQQNPLLVMPYSGYSNWTANSAPGLLSTDFAEVTLAGIVNVGSNPDFSAAGSIMQLGFYRGNSGNTGYNTDCGIDNWSVNIVPEPATMGLVALGALAALKRRRATV
ncbi:MAG: PEP-CTERM sorting domain-containing protein [Planctomycetota bacterium]|nr:PEP-CTERM sorting domain-containing protein [Planctomycetota bacterium]